MNSERLTSVVFTNPDIRLGFHISKEKTLKKTFERMTEAPLSSYQIYISNGRAYQAPKADASDIREAKNILFRNGSYACVHGCLLYNLAGATDGTKNANYHRNLQNTKNGLMSELDIAAGFGGGVVVHIGSRKEKKEGIAVIAKTIASVLTEDNPATKLLSKGLSIPIDEMKLARKIILENAAGEGNKIGANLDEIAQIINKVPKDLQPQIKVCIDTAHIFGAGQYDFGSPKSVVKFYKDFDKKIGLDKLEVFHFNDSRVPFGSKKDRHENIGMGYIFGVERDEDLNGDGVDGLLKFVEKAEQYRIPLIGEPPAKTKDKEPAPGGIWDYAVISSLCKLEEEFICE
ncbi:MAG TPA: deoxyribonuclease IV [Saprospiraceae bacterium]|nr:deoxyribonuclease IV [Saprospiraceae bacterium]